MLVLVLVLLSVVDARMTQRINIDSARYDQSTFEGRAKHFFTITNPLNLLASDAELEEAKAIVENYRAGKEDKTLSEEDLWRAKSLYDSAYHPQSGEKLFLPGRMSFQVPGNMTITGCMMTFYKSTPAGIFWHWTNQTFNAIVNYTNRNASAVVTNEELGQVYVAAVGASVATALSFNKLVASSPTLANGIAGRLVPLVAVAAANCINIPLMRRQEVIKGIYIQDDNGNDVGKSGNAAKAAIMQVIPARVLMASPAMMLIPIVMTRLEKTKTLINNPKLKAPLTVLLTGCCLTFATPLACAIFPQTSGIHVNDLEPELQTSLKTKFPNKEMYYYNKGL